MKIFVISLVKNEADIIAYNLEQASKWANKIFVLDNGSTDGTWEIVQSMQNDTITAWKQDFQVYDESMRATVFNHFRHLSQEGDWWCIKLDADEFYLNDPRTFLATVPKRYHVVFHDSIEFQLTHEDLEEYSFGNSFEQDIQKYRYYLPTTWAEIAFFRYRNRLQWLEDKPCPRHIGLFYQKKIRLKHYQYRSPQQIQKRIASRRKAMEAGYWVHLPADNWQQVLRHRKELLKMEGGADIETYGCRNSHRNRWPALVVKTVLHGLGVWP